MDEVVWFRYGTHRGTSYMDVLGIDVSKDDFHACLIQGSGRTRKSFPNGTAGYKQVLAWIKNRRCSEYHACMEATGAYWLGLASALYESGAIVSVVNPSQTAMFARSQLRRTKTDRVDAEMMAEFCQTQQPSPWSPPAPEVLELRGLLNYRDQLVGEQIRLKQMVKQVHVGKDLRKVHAKQIKSVQSALTSIEAALRKLLKTHDSLQNQVDRLTSIQGIGFVTAVSIVAKLPMERLRDGKAAAAYIGVTPRERQSETSVHGKPHICKTGNAGLRRDLYMPAMVAIRFNPILREFAQRLQERGKPAKVIIVAVMRKLIVLAFSTLKRAQPALPAAL
jgi:transposase